MSAGVSRPLPRRLEKTVDSRSERVSNTKEAYPRHWQVVLTPADSRHCPIPANAVAHTCRPVVQLLHVVTHVGADCVVEVTDLRMRYGTNDVLHGVDFTIRRGEVLVLLGPERGRQDHHDRDPRGLPAAVGRRRSRCWAQNPATADEAWRARIGVVLQSWRDHGRWRVWELLDHLGSFYVPYSDTATGRGPTPPTS